MPGRVSVRSSRSAPAAKTRASTRTVSPSTKVPDEGEPTSLRVQVCAFFAEAQRSTTGSRKLVVGLRKVQEACCYEPPKPRKGAAQEDFDEDDFNSEVMRCVLRFMPVKKSEPAGDRLIRFLGLFLKHATDADNAIYQDQDSSGSQGFPETPSSRLSTQIISLVIPLLPAKDKAIRFRSTQMIAHLINTLDSVDDELFHPVRLGLLKRLRDKESTVRAQAVYGLGRLASELDNDQADDDSDDDGVAGSVLEKLLDVLQNDPSADVRRSLLLNLPFTPTTLPFLLERARDLDPSIRRALYSRLLPALADFRHLSLTHREKLLRWGLRDRDDNVKKAAARLFRERWIEDCARPRDAEGQVADLKPGHVSEPTSAGLLELLERIDVVNAGVDGGIALDAMKEFWDGRPDYCNYITFDEQFWKDLTPESAFIARTFNDYCRDSALNRLEEKMPEVTRFAFLIQQNINGLVETVRKSALQEDTEEDFVHQEFIVEQLLNVALTLDYSDEVGRRTMFSLMREALALVELPEEPTRLVVDVLRTACGNNSAAEREFSGVVLEAIAEVHDAIMGDDDEAKPEAEGDDSFHSARSEISDDTTPRKAGSDTDEMDEEKAIREIMVNMKCLHIAQCMLQNIASDLEQNVHLVTMLNNLVIPAVRSQEAPIRERGLLCLGLCCLLDKNLAEENLTLFFHCFTKGHEALQNIAIQIIGDILSAHPSLLVAPTQPSLDGEEVAEEQEHPLQKPIYKLFSKGLKSSSAHIQTTTCTALCKLMLSSPSATCSSGSSILNNDELLRLLVVAYFDPETTSNPALRQALSYFLPVYCHSRKENMQRMGRIALSVLHWCISVKEEMDVDGEEDASGEMVGLTVVVAHLVDWTDGKKLAAAMHGIGDAGQAEDGYGDVHLDLAIEIFEKILGVCSKDERKLYVSMLGKLNISAHSETEKLQTLAGLVREAVDDKVASDATTRNTLIKVQSTVDKALSDGRGAGRTRSVAPSTTEDAEDATTVDSDKASDVDGNESMLTTPALSPQKKTRGMPRASRKAVDAGSPMDEEDVSDETVLATPAPSPRKRSQAKQEASKAKAAAEPISELDEDSVSTIAGELETMKLKEEEDDDEDTPQPPRRTRSKKVAKSTISTAAGEATPEAVDRGNLKTTTVDDTKDLDVTEGDREDLSGVTAHVPQPIEAPKRRGRPPKAATAPPRKSIRSGRRKATSVVENDGSGEEQ